MKHLLCAGVMTIASAAHAVELQLPATARQMITRDTQEDRFSAPVAPFAQGALTTHLIEGSVARSAWRIDQAGLTPLQLITPLRAQLEEAGFRIVLDCAAEQCGGYDFRFATEVLPAPNMYVNIRNYHVVTGFRGEGDAQEVVTVLTSASSGASFAQIIQASRVATPTAVEAVAPAPVVRGSLAETLLQEGHVVLAALEFESGTSDLGSGPFSDLAALAQTLQDQPDMRIALVGHTDNVGGLDGNITLSRSRAAEVRARLIEQYDIPPDRLVAQGMGYLSPLTTNVTAQGREANRRVEAVVLQN